MTPTDEQIRETRDRLTQAFIAHRLQSSDREYMRLKISEVIKAADLLSTWLEERAAVQAHISDMQQGIVAANQRWLEERAATMKDKT
jgi:hypothetical protein